MNKCLYGSKKTSLFGKVNSWPEHLERILPLCLSRHYRNVEVIVDEGIMSGIPVLSTIAMKTLS